MTKRQQLKTNKPKKFRPRKCDFKGCRKWYTPEREGQNLCSDQCAIDNLPVERAKRKRKAIKQFRETDKATLTRQAQQVFNKYIRLRDKGKPCISCGHTGNRQIHASHFRPTGGNSALRFNEDNCHAACSICNTHLSGNLVPYKKALIEKIGNKRYEALINNSAVKKWGIDELKEIIETFKQRIKDERG